MKKDVVNGVVTIAIAVAVFVGAGSFSKGGASLADNPALYPRILSVVVFVLGALLLVNTFLAVHRNSPSAKTGLWSSAGAKRVAALFGILIGYTAGIYLIGFVASTLAFTFCVPLLLGTKVKTAVLVSIPVTVILYIVFFVFFKVPVLNGILFA